MGSLVTRNISVFCLLQVALYFKAMPNSIDFYKGIFLHVIPVRIIVSFFNANGDVVKTIGCQSLKNFPKNVYDGVCFNKIASLCCTNCNPTITRIHHRIFSEDVPQNYIPSSTTEASLHGFCMIVLYKILEKLLRDIFVIPCLTKLQTSNL